MKYINKLLSILLCCFIIICIGCNNKPNIEPISSLSDEQIPSLLSKTYQLHRSDLDFNASLNQIVLPPNESDLRKIIPELVSVNLDGFEGKYRYSILQYNNFGNTIRFLILFSHDDSSNQNIICAIFLIDNQISYNSIDKNIDYSVNIKTAEGYPLLEDNDSLKPLLFRAAPPKYLKENGLFTKYSNGEIIPKTAYVFYTDQGFACVYYDENNIFEGKLLLNSPELITLYSVLYDY